MSLRSCSLTEDGARAPNCSVVAVVVVTMRIARLMLNYRSAVPQDDPIFVVNVTDCTVWSPRARNPSRTSRAIAVPSLWAWIQTASCAWVEKLDDNGSVTIISNEEWRRRRQKRSCRNDKANNSTAPNKWIPGQCHSEESHSSIALTTQRSPFMLPLY